MKAIFYTTLVVLLIAGKTTFAQRDTTAPNTPKNMNDTSKTQAFIDKFFVPASAKTEFLERMAYNRGFISKLDGFIQDNAYIQTDENGNLTVVTVALWRNADAIAKAKEAVFAEYKRIGFNPQEFYERHKITMDRGVYNPLEQ